MLQVLLHITRHVDYPGLGEAYARLGPRRAGDMSAKLPSRVALQGTGTARGWVDDPDSQAVN